VNASMQECGNAGMKKRKKICNRNVLNVLTMQKEIDQQPAANNQPPVASDK
jgi:hypothetical protein